MDEWHRQHAKEVIDHKDKKRYQVFMKLREMEKKHKHLKPKKINFYMQDKMDENKT